MLAYNVGKDDLKDWLVAETSFNVRNCGKFETIMSLGNGYLGIRSATEEKYCNEKRNTFVAGTFNKFDDTEVSELPNCADVTAIKLLINDVPLDLNKVEPKEYIRFLNLKTAELTRRFLWETQETGIISFESKRFVSLSDLHLVGQKISVRALSKDVSIDIVSGIDGQQTNSGVQHFSDGDKRLFDKKCLQLIQTTTQSRIDFVINMVHNCFINGNKLPDNGRIVMDRRQVSMEYTFSLKKGDELTIEKFASIHTSRDREWIDKEYSLEALRERSWRELVDKSDKGYEYHAQESARAWSQKVWDKANIVIDSIDGRDQLSVRFAQYHLTAMTPAHDNRMNIGAKGLTGEGYKGHTFWDTEIFMLPYFTWHFPEIARSLLEYRYLSLPGAHKKAKENGYDGAMFPWESAWLDEGETTPVWGAADIITGKPTKIWSGFIEQHITSDIVYAVCQYYTITNDQDFMDKYGYELVLDAAKFWASRLEWDEARQQYCINDVVGPDEYKEHVNNNAFTNYMAWWSINKAIEFRDELKASRPELYNRLDEKLGLENAYMLWKERVNKIFLPQPTKDGVLPQDDTYLSKKDIDLTPYKNQTQVGSIFKDYNLEQVNQMQVTKQADVLLLFYLLGDLFEEKVKKASWNYYEPRTLHDSSLSLSTHSILASDFEDKKLAYKLFRQAADIDLGQNMKSSDHGIHAASLGGVWQCVVNGFGGVRVNNGILKIDPHLPDEWNGLKFSIIWRNDRIRVEIDHKNLSLTNETGNNKELEIEVRGNKVTLKNELKLSL